MSKKDVSKKTLAAAYLVDVRTLNDWIKRHLHTIGISIEDYNKIRRFTPIQVVKIYECLGEP